MPWRLLVLPLLAVVAACPAAQAPTGPADAGTPPLSHQARGPRIRLGTSAIAFGQVPLFEGEHVTNVRKLVVFNEGDADLELQKVELSAPDPELELSAPEGWAPGADVAARAGSNAVEFELRFTPKALGHKSWDLIVSSSDPGAPELRLSISAEVVPALPCHFTVTPEVLVPHVASPEIREVPVRIHNEGTAPVEQCLLKNVRLDGDDASFISLADGGIDQRVLRANETLEVPVRVTSKPGIQPTEVHAELRFGISSPMRPEVTVPISAQLVGESCFVIAPEAVEFDQIAAGCSSPRRSIFGYNLCGSDLRLTGVSMTSAGGVPAGGPGCSGTVSCPEFHLVESPAIPSGGFPIPVGGHVTFEAEYVPLDQGSDTGNARVEINGAPYDVQLHGQSSSPLYQTDVFPPAPPPKSDLLLVIDNSTSMAPYASSLATNFGSFIKYLKSAQQDFQLAVITSDPTSSADFLVGSNDPDAVLTPSTPDLESQFANKVDVGFSSTATPHCFEQALNALTSPAHASQAAALLRNDASLSVICISATTDDSSRSVSDYLNDLWGIRGANRKPMFTLNAIAGMSPSCPGDSGRLSSAVRQSNGVADDICTSDWSKTLEELGVTCNWGYQTSWILTSLPNLALGSLEVSVDGIRIAPTDAKGKPVWSYDPMTNAISFEPIYVPEPGQTLTVAYPVFCNR